VKYIKQGLRIKFLFTPKLSILEPISSRSDTLLEARVYISKWWNNLDDTRFRVWSTPPATASLLLFRNFTVPIFDTLQSGIKVHTCIRRSCHSIHNSLDNQIVSTQAELFNWRLYSIGVIIATSWLSLYRLFCIDDIDDL
jgi:hypothetical protein